MKKVLTSRIKIVILHEKVSGNFFMNYSNNPWSKNVEKKTKTKAKKLLEPPEWHIQAKISQYVKDNYPDVVFTFAHNGYRGNPASMAKAKMMGLRPGFPDLFFLLKNSKYGGLGVEVKRNEKEKLRKTQLKVKEEFLRSGYAYECVYSVDGFKKIFNDYLSIKK